MGGNTIRTRAPGDSLDADGKPLMEVHGRHILIRVPLNDADVERTRRLAEHVRAEAVKGTDFSLLVHRYSHYQGRHTPDGEIGFVPLSSLQSSIRAGLDSLETGEVSPVLVNQIGFNVFKVLDRKP